VSVIPAKSNNKKGQNFVINPASRYETAKADKAIAVVNKKRLRIKRFTNSFMLTKIVDLR
jgi:hypothetical protein